MECGGLGVLTWGAAVYPQRPYLAGKAFYVCPCGAKVGCHPGGMVPLGLPAGPETQRWRSEAHRVFDPLWQAKKARGGSGARRKGYLWLAGELGIHPDDCHISHMNAETARRVVEICRPHLARLRHNSGGRPAGPSAGAPSSRPD